jgi:hypothetical protein
MPRHQVATAHKTLMVVSTIFGILWFCIFAYCYVTYSDLYHVVPVPSCRRQLQHWQMNLHDCYFHL